MKYSSQEGRRKEGLFFTFAFKGEPLADAIHIECQIPKFKCQMKSELQIPDFSNLSFDIPLPFACLPAGRDLEI
jgi:hypothetical protein